SALLGIALGLLFDLNLQLAVIFTCCLIALLLVTMETRKSLETDTLLGILAHSSLAIGLVVLSFTTVQIDYQAYLFGDLLTVSASELLWLLGGSGLALAVLLTKWNALLSFTLQPELAQVEGLNIRQLRVLLMLVIAVVVAVAMKIVGVLLITSLLIIPAATARLFARSPEQMALGASLGGCIAVLGGLTASWLGNTPPGPSIVVVAALLFAIARLWRRA
ncbi:MAG: iron chelate uptake ABC transporter family permease subunit, partial [Pseudomonadota bacterium]